ncbi:MAG: hypothetical protein Q7W51_04635 [Coriobacteriia bacterium]|nr:hypothetical protein [Coriobacteriia bacterium]
MNEQAVVRHDHTAYWRGALWGVGVAVCASVLASAVFVVGVGIAEFSAIMFGFTEEVGVPVFGVIIALTAIAYAVFIHMIVRGIGRSAEVPWTIWPAMAALPTAWVFIVLASGSDVLEPILAIMQLVGIAIAFVTLGQHRWAQVAR